MAKKRKKLIKYNQTVRKIFGGEGFDEGVERLPLDNLIPNSEARERKIDEILAQIEHTPAEAVAIREQFGESKLKKITPKRIAGALAKLRSIQKRNRLEEACDGTFDEDGRFRFFHSFEFSIFDEKFHKIVELECPPLEDGEIVELHESMLLSKLDECKADAVSKMRKRIEAFLRYIARKLRYFVS